MEEKISFLEQTDKNVYTVLNEAGVPVFEITGYQLGFKFNFDLLNDAEDLVDMTTGAAELFRKLAENELLEIARVNNPSEETTEQDTKPE